MKMRKRKVVSVLSQEKLFITKTVQLNVIQMKYLPVLGSTQVVFFSEWLMKNTRPLGATWKDQKIYLTWISQI